MHTMSSREKAYVLLEEINKSSIDHEMLNKIKRNLQEASYTMSEAYLWPDATDSVSTEQIILCYKLVQYLIANDGILDPKFIL